MDGEGKGKGAETRVRVAPMGLAHTDTGVKVLPLTHSLDKGDRRM